MGHMSQQVSRDIMFLNGRLLVYMYICMFVYLIVLVIFNHVFMYIHFIVITDDKGLPLETSDIFLIIFL